MICAHTVVFNNNSKRTPKKNLRNQAESKKCNIEIAGEKKNMKIEDQFNQI